MGQNRFIVFAAVAFVVLTLIGRLGGLVVDWLWFQSVGLTGVFTTRLVAQVTLFAAGGLLFFAAYMVNALVALRIASRNEPPRVLVGWDQDRRRNRLITLVVVGAGVVLAFLIATGLSASWDAVLRALNPVSFNVADPLFGQDVSFFVFTLPIYGLAQSWFMFTIVVCLLTALAIYAVKVVLPRLPQTGESLEGDLMQLRQNLYVGTDVKAHLSILVALGALGFAVRYWLDMYHLVYSSSGLIYGAGYADVNATWPALWLMVVVSVAFAILALVNIRRRGFRLLLIGVGVWVGVSLLAVDVYPGFVQRFEVLPSELDKERTYLEHNIRLTNQAYALDRITEVEYPAEDAVTGREVSDNPGTIRNIRLWDPQPLLDTYNQIQSIRLYYDFLDVDVDRYMIDGEYRQVMLSARELSPDKLPQQAQTWVNRRLQFTHGYGLAMSPVNEVTPEGLPQFFLRDVPPRGKMEIARPEVYYGENTNDYVIIKTTTPEFDYPRGDDNVFVTYEGESGVSIGSYLRRLLFAWQFADVNIMLTGSITPESRIMYNRNIKERAQKIAPFLAFDRDPYIVAADGRLFWILDAYTYTDRYPYSQPVRMPGNVNYLRNSVKVVMDAYEGNVRFYIADESDPLVATYAQIFPQLFAPLDEMPDYLRAHLRYPQDLFSVQAELYRTYHMRDPRVFYNREDTWAIPNEVYVDKPVQMQPYYIIMRLPGEQREEFVLILPYTPPDKNNMITWLAARSDGEHYGKLVAYRYPKDKLIFGPMQIEARIDQDPRISEQLTLWNQAGSRVIRGNMIVIPVGQSNLYVEPIYLQSEQTKLPEMKRVILATGNRVVMEPTVDIGLPVLLGQQVASPIQPEPPATITPPETPAATPTPAPPAPAPTPTPAPVVSPPPAGELSDSARAFLERYSQLRQDMDALEADLRRLLEQLEENQQ